MRKLKANGKLVVDTNAVIAYREGLSSVCNWIDETDILFLPVVVLGELLYGAINSAKPQKNENEIKIFSANSVLVPVDEGIAIRYAKVRLKLKKAGCPIPENDIWVAATCLYLDAPLLSKDAHFDSIPGLDIINWEKDNGDIK
ncbi:MAG: type II toxin-antitoxin system VapC family toxin [Candidatus Methanoperedens sp.]|nr:type II toxin-antitoxin system VapC family toxin [Candidatus Methanoperedens sp.]